MPDDDIPPTERLHALDLSALALEGREKSGGLALRTLTRLLADAPQPLATEANGLVRWAVAAHWRAPRGGVGPVRTSADDRLWLHLTGSASVPQTCQRCLGAVWVEMDLDRWFRFEPDETRAEAEDEDAEEDVLVWRARLDLAELIEDELILALPLVPICRVGRSPAA